MTEKCCHSISDDVQHPKQCYKDATWKVIIHIGMIVAVCYYCDDHQSDLDGFTVDKEKIGEYE